MFLPSCRLYFLLFISTFLLLQACSPSPESHITIVKGRVSNQLTGEPIAGLPLIITSYRDEYSSDCDSVTSALTDKAGNYEVSFAAAKEKWYQVSIDTNSLYWSTRYDYPPRILKAGETNIVNLVALPYTILQIHLVANINAAYNFYLHYQTRDAKNKEAWLGGMIALDSIQVNSNIDTIFNVTVFPLRNYEIWGSYYEQMDSGNYKDEEILSFPDVYVDYGDTNKYLIRL